MPYEAPGLWGQGAAWMVWQMGSANEVLLPCLSN
jgi:hypothetical protein